MELRAYRYRIYPSNKQKDRIVDSFKTCKVIYNELLALNIDCWKFGEVSLNKFDFCKYLAGKYSNIYAQSKQNVADRVSKAFQNFFRRVKNSSCKKKGFPRFKSRVNSITYPQAGFKLLSDKRLRLSKIGNVPIVLHRVPKGKIKTLTIKQNRAGQWFAVFCCELPDTKVVHSNPGSVVGIDVGLESFATLSDTTVISNPRHLIGMEQRIKLLQRRLSRKTKGSANRRKARLKLARHHLRVSNARSDWQHKLSREITNKYCTISVEKLNVKGMVKNHCLAKHIHDASWSSFIQMLSYKAVTCGGQLNEVNPRNTSKTCSKCGRVNDMPLSKREFVCLSCGFVCHRDLNASLNISTVGLTGTLTPVDIEPLHPACQVASAVVESGTIRNKC